MADRYHFLSVLFLLSLFASIVLCRNLSPRSIGSAPTTATLDVSASLGQALRVLSFDPDQALDQEMKSFHHGGGAATSGGFTLELHSRDFLPTAAQARHTDYKTLTLARLHRDSARVKSIAARLALAAHGVKRSDLKPLAEEKELAAMAQAIKGPIVSGTSQGSGEYFSRVGIGKPAKPLYMVLDTGSDVTWVQCQPCTDCYQQSDPVFEPSASSSYSPLPCDSPRCHDLDISACRNSSAGGSSCLYQVSYGDGSYTIGDFATETVTLGDSAPVSGVAIGCGHDNEGLFVGAAGLLALGGGPLSFPSQISARTFSYCLVDRDSPASSTLELGGGSASTAAVAAPMLRNRKLDTFYYVGLSGISVGGAMLSIPPSAFAMDESGSGGVIVDSGTAVTRLQAEAYEALRDAFRRGTAGLPAAAGVSLFDTCYDLSSRTSVDVPTVAFHFPEGRELRLPAKNYLIPVDGVGTYCLAFAPTKAPLSIIGNVQQQGTRVSFDLDKSVVGFTPNNC
ncbi:protein ASPARTIC PROTEASE IN GUARD CELL 1 [Elaeis guineensis]|uniref:LOW QUALITY PROTEIN: protein ASPARTIC PROTEASE IN GUARD CELL 1 n=1 Tax=Elaeis guineensis var. tenera TaxID=51953 RepID=A0A6I9RHZ0_ELAGV|nr:LOW QUALITY PROTEIN: protein ASPARTIC PROTEASE IN GUARD CELL 1 [Elaeis guineensis]